MNALRPLLRHPLALATLLLAALVVLWAPDAVVGEGVYWHHDLRHHHFPWRIWAAGEWRQGDLPLWASSVANGYPLMADGQAGALYPPTMLLFLLLPAPLAMNLSVLLHHLWAGVGTFLLARSLGRSTRASMLAAVGFAFSGFLVTHTLYLGMQNALAWWPFTLFALVRATGGDSSPHREPGRPRPRWWAGVTLGLWWMLVAGHVQIAVYGWLLTGLVFLWRIHPAWRRDRLRAWAGMAGAAVAAAALCAPQLLATLELSRFSMREGGVAAAFAGIGSLPPQELVNGVLPWFFGYDRPADITQTYYHRGEGYWGMGENHWEMAFYLGIPVVFLAARAAFRRGARFWTGVALVALVLMLGRFTPVYALVRMLPGLGYFRFPVRFAAWLTLAFVLLAAHGLDLLFPPGAPRPGLTPARRRWLGWMGAIALAASVGFTVTWSAIRAAEPQLREMLTARFSQKAELPPPPEDLGPLQRASLPDPEPVDPDAIPAKVDHILAELVRSTHPGSARVLWPLGLWALLLLGTGLTWRGRGDPRHVAWAAVGLLFLDLWIFGGRYHPRVPVDQVRHEPTFLSLLEGNPDDYRVTVVDRRVDPALDTELASASLGLLWGLNDVIVTSPLLMVRNELYLARVGLDIGAERGRVKMEQLLENLPLAHRLALRYLLSVHEVTDPRLEPVMSGAVNLYENPSWLPLAHAVGCVHPVQGPEEAWSRLPDLDTAGEAVVEAAPGASLDPALTACRDLAPPDTTVELLEHGDERWRIRVRGTQPVLLVVAETAYPGWEARLDGKPIPIHVTDLVFRGLEIPAGDHELVLSYRPAWLKPAWAAFFLGLVALLGMAVGRPSIRKRRPPAVPADPP